MNVESLNRPEIQTTQRSFRQHQLTQKSHLKFDITNMNFLAEMRHLAEDMYGSRSAYTFPQSLLDNVQLSTIDKDFLKDPGLPQEQILSVSFDPAYYGLRHFQANDFDALSMQPNEGTWLVLGGNLAELICIDLTRNDAIWSLMRTHEGINRFVNTSVHQLIGCLGAYIELFSARAPGGSPTGNEQLVMNFRERMLNFDSPCLSHPETYWSVVLELMQYDLDG